MQGMERKNPPNILLRGCTESDESVQYIWDVIVQKKAGVRPRQEEIQIPGFSAKKSATVLYWPWGIQIWVSTYRTRPEQWWDTLLHIVSARSVYSSVKLILLNGVDTAPSQIQMVFRAHLEDDYQNARYILTCAEDTYIERSLESRCVTMVSSSGLSRWDDARLILSDDPASSVSWEQVNNAWLADIPGYRILDAIFEPALEQYPAMRKELAIGWCRYADLLKLCYQEITILHKAWQWLQTVTSKHRGTSSASKKGNRGRTSAQRS